MSSLEKDRQGVDASMNLKKVIEIQNKEEKIVACYF